MKDHDGIKGFVIGCLVTMATEFVVWIAVFKNGDGWFPGMGRSAFIFLAPFPIAFFASVVALFDDGCAR